ncbi:MAG: succinylglutamate-semialdehyde dehydrogenase [Planctomycetota bacterium]
MPQSFSAINPANGQTVWTGVAASAPQAAAAVAASHEAFAAWSATPMAERVALLRKFAALCGERVEDVAKVITAETGKTLWESRGEAKLLGAKVEATLAAWEQRCGTSSFAMGDNQAVTRYAPHGVMVVLGPFNFPAHLPNGHAVPALLAGNTVVFKPSEKTPGTGELLVSLFHEAGFPSEVVQVVQGARETAEALIHARETAGVLFTGSYAAGRAINQAMSSRPEVIVALEMGGNNPLVVHDPGDDAASLDAAAYHAVVSAFVTSGQRCTCARRILVTEGPWADPFVERFLERVDALTVGLPTDDPEPFYGPVISEAQGEAVLRTYTDLVDKGCRPLRETRMLQSNPALLSPGVLDATGVELPDAECFGPITTLRRLKDLDEAISVANDTRYGLAASLLSQRDSAWDAFVKRVRAGILNWNGPTTGASGKLPFGGIGRSGNHRPAGFYSVDYCAYPVGCLEGSTLSLPGSTLPGLD